LALSGPMSPATPRLLGSLGYRYDSSFIDDDAAHALDADSIAAIVELPLNGSAFFSRRPSKVDLKQPPARLARRRRTV
jgi:hypothetical protein